jgi:hypothetical protein
VANFVVQFTRLESENAQLRKAIKVSADLVLEANKLTTDAQNENILLKDELKKLKQKMKDEQEARREAAIASDKKEGALRESITNLMGKFLFAGYLSTTVFLIDYSCLSRRCRYAYQSCSQASGGFNVRRPFACY